MTAERERVDRVRRVELSDLIQRKLVRVRAAADYAPGDVVMGCVVTAAARKRRMAGVVVVAVVCRSRA